MFLELTVLLNTCLSCIIKVNNIMEIFQQSISAYNVCTKPACGIESHERSIVAEK